MNSSYDCVVDIAQSNISAEQTTLRYRIPEPGNIGIEVFDIQGQKVFSFSSSHASAGRYTIDLDTNNFSNGLYLVSFYVNGYYSVQKMVVAR